jgi:Fur family ferric uptake transcriptional regulator
LSQEPATTPTSDDARHDDDSARLRRLGLRVTMQRLLVLDALRAARGHATAEEILASVAAHHPAFNLATVYRNLDLLAHRGVVARTHLGGTAWVYELAGETTHHHLVCEVCGGVSQLDDRILAATRAIIEREQGFRVSSTHIALFGTCAACAAKAAGENDRQRAPV